MRGALFSYGRWIQADPIQTMDLESTSPNCPDDVGQQFALRSAKVEATSSPVQKKERRFFCELEWATLPCALMVQPNLERRDERVAAAIELPNVLRARVLERARALRAPAYRAPVSLAQTDPAQTKLISDVLSACIRSHFDNPELPGGAKRVVEAFANFASGALRHESGTKNERGEEVWTCEPDGPYYFFFAEIAWAAVEQGIDERFWMGILHGLISSQYLYVQAYYDTTHTQRWSFDRAGAAHRFSESAMPARRTRELWTFVNTTKARDELCYESCRRAAEFFG